MISADPRVVIVHDYLTQRGGAERVVLDLMRAFPGARLRTSIWNPDTTFPEFAEIDIETTRLDRSRALRRDPRRAFPVLSRTFGDQVIHDADVVICSSSGWSHRVQTSAPKIVYCHNPARWLYQADDYLAGVPRWVRHRFVAATGGMRDDDAAAARTADRYLANSSVVAARVRTAYGLEAEVVHPARGLSVTGRREPIPGIEPGFLLTVGRARGYKNTDAVVAAMTALPDQRLVVVGHATRPVGPNVCTLAGLSDAQLRWLFDNACALVAVAHEDFGLTVVEAQSFGLPSVVLRAGGYVDTAVEGVTTVFVDEPTPHAVADGIATLRAATWDTEAIRVLGERFSPDAFTARMHHVVDRVLDRELTRPAVQFGSRRFDPADLDNVHASTRRGDAQSASLSA